MRETLEKTCKLLQALANHGEETAATYACQKTSKGTRRIILSRVKLNLSSLGLGGGAGLFKLPGGLVAQLRGLVFGAVYDGIGSVKFGTSLERRRLHLRVRIRSRWTEEGAP